ncbi:MAG: N-acetylmuramoyl-L-alanine amidase [Myxococcota bacterium]
MLLLLLACTRSEPPVPPPHIPDPGPSTAWPSPEVVFVPPDIEVPEGFGTKGVFLSAGHGTGRNIGNLGCRCQLEQDFTLRASHDLAESMRGLGLFEVTEARTGKRRPTYGARLRHLKRSGADVMVELHSDSRGGRSWKVTGTHESGRTCYATTETPGLAVLVSDEGSEALRDARLTLARSVADALWEAGFTYFDGYQYGDQYDGDVMPGVYRDRRGLMMLRRPKVPSILIETHNALDPNEVARWDEPRTQEMFFRAVTKGLVDYYAVTGDQR